MRIQLKLTTGPTPPIIINVKVSKVTTSAWYGIADETVFAGEQRYPKRNWEKVS